MADGVIRRWIRIVFDAVSAKKVETQLGDALASAGKKGGESFIREVRAAFDKRLADLKVQLAKGLINPKQFKEQADLAARAFNDSVVKGLESARAAGTLTNSEYLKLARTLKKVGDDGENAWDKIKSGITRAGAVLATAFGLRAILRFGQESVHTAAESEKVWRELAGTVDAAGESFSGMEKQVRKNAEAFQDTTVHSTEDYAKSLQRLIAITGDVGASIHNMNFVADVAARFFGGDLSAATDAVAKGMNTGVVTINRMKFTLEDLAKRSLGAAAEQTQTFSGKVQQLNNQWGKFKEQIGGVLIGAKGTTGALDLITSSVKTMILWVDANKESLRRWVTEAVQFAIDSLNGLKDAFLAFQKARGAIETTTGSQTASSSGALAKDAKGLNAQIKVMQRQTKQLFDEKARLQKTLDDFKKLPQKVQELGAESTERDLKSVDDQLARINEDIDAAKNKLKDLGQPNAPGDGGPRTGKNFLGDEKDLSRAKDIAAEFLRVQDDLIVKRLMLEQGFTEALAREEVRRRNFAKPPVAPTGVTVADVQAVQDKVDDANLQIAAGLTDTLVPAVETTTSKVMELHEVMADFPSAKIARQFSSPWTKALDLISDEVEGKGTLFRELGEAWAEGGLKGIASLAAQKVKQNIAEVVEWGAKALGFLALGQPVSAGHAFASAAEHGAAALAWGAIAGGGGGGGSSASSAGGIGGSTGPSASSASIENAPPEIHLYFKGPKMFSPEMEEFVHFNAINARQRFGQNANIHIHREG